MKFPTPKDHNQTATTTEPAPEPETAGDDHSEEPTFGDDLGRGDLLAAIETYQEWVADSDKYPVDVDLDGIPVEVSDKMKRTAGKVCHVKGSDRVKYIRYAYKAYQKWGWEKFAETIRHELIHVHTVQNYQKGGHGRLFKNLVRSMETHRHCETFAEEDAKYLLFCEDCDSITARRFRKSKTVKNPGRYRSKCCKAPLRVEQNR
jgi:SprT-like protein